MPFNPNHLADQLETTNDTTLLHFRGKFEHRPNCVQIINTATGLGPYSVTRWQVVRVVTPYADGWTVLEVKSS